MKDFRIDRLDEFHKRHIGLRAGVANSGEIILTTADPDNDVTSLIITKDEAIDLMAWLSEATR